MLPSNENVQFSFLVWPCYISFNVERMFKLNYWIL